MNSVKTKSIFNCVGSFKTGFSNDDHFRRFGEENPTFLEKQKIIIKCPECSKEMQKGSMATHLKFVHHKDPSYFTNSLETNFVKRWTTEMLVIRKVQKK